MANITKRLVDATKPPAEGRVYVWDDEIRGFGLLVLPSGVKSFLVQYRTAAGRSRRFTIGRFGTFTADQARTEALGILHAAAKGGDPVEDRKGSRAAADVAALFERYLEDHVRAHNAESTIVEVERLVRLHLIPKLGHLKIAAVTTADIAKLHRDLAATPRQANFALAVASKAFNLAELWGLRPQHSNPVEGIKRYAENERDRFLSGEELARLGATFAEARNAGLPWAIKKPDSKHLAKTLEARRSPVSEVAMATIMLLLFTGARLTEMLKLQWDQVDLANGTLSLPARKGGGRKPHPVSLAVLEMLRKMPRVAASPWVLPRESDGRQHVSKEVVENAWQRLRHHAGLDDVRLHDLRHTVGTYAGQFGGTFLISHVLRQKTITVTGRYVNEDADPIRAMSESVGNKIAAGLDGRQTSDQSKRASSGQLT